MNSAALEIFHPVIADWFREAIGAPTDLQRRTWPLIASGEHVLVTAPTGSGKTFAAFLWAIHQFAAGAYAPGATRVLYVSPLKALNHDIQRNLLGPIEALRTRFERTGASFPPLRVRTRSGDTTAVERRRLLRRPPEILITTPESLNLMLSTVAGQDALAAVRTVILDEIHAVVDSKRGAHLMTAVERLTLRAGEMQRIALSATVRPVELAAAFLGGYRRVGSSWLARPVRRISSAERKRYALRVERPEPAGDGPDAVWRPIAEACRQVIRRNRSTLVFVNSRRLCERMALLINEGEDPPLAYAHHGSLSRDIRVDVERRLKEGRLRAIVATNSLELGIDIGDLDEVVLVQSPPSIASAIQRIGRAGHRVGEISRAWLFPTHGRDLLHAAVLAAAAPAQEIESIRPVRCPLDVLAQVVLSMLLVVPWDLDALFDAIRAAWSYHDLSRPDFDAVVAMLAGRYQQARLRELPARILLEADARRASALPNARQALYAGGGTIPDRGAYHLRHAESLARIGELDEEYVWEAHEGQVFVLGTQRWQIRRITHNDVFVAPAGTTSAAAPFWRGETSARHAQFALRIGAFLETANALLAEGAPPAAWEEATGLTGPAGRSLWDFLGRQRASTGCDLPHRHHLVLEHVASGPQGAPGEQLILHAVWGARVTRPYALALQAAWLERYGVRPEVHAEDDVIALQLPGAASAEAFFSLVAAERVESWLRAGLVGSGVFGAQFRQCAGRALLIRRPRMRQRLPLWVNRLRARTLFAEVSRYPGFPIVRETWRSCLEEEFDLETLRGLLEELEQGRIRWSETWTPVASPFAEAAAWRQVNEYMYRGDELGPAGEGGAGADDARQVALDDGLRPQLPPALVCEFEQKRQRLAPGYSPGSAPELAAWLEERRYLPEGEWEALRRAMRRDHNLDLEACHVRRPGRSEVLPSDGDAKSAECLAQWLRYYGPRPTTWVRSSLGLRRRETDAWLDELADAGRIVRGRLTRDAPDEEVCDAENLGSLLRMRRRASRAALEPRPAADLPRFLAERQGVGRDRAVHEVLSRLSGFPAPAAHWEREILPARVGAYRGTELDELVRAHGWIWYGDPRRRIRFCASEDVDVLGPPGPVAPPSWFRDPYAKYDFAALQRISGLGTAELTARLWEAVWAGAVTCDAFGVLRRGLELKFRPPAAAPRAMSRHGRSSAGRGAFQRWRAAAPIAGHWLAAPAAEEAADAVEVDERRRERARRVLHRYGVVFPLLLAREPPGLRWADVFPALRILELAGEAVGGHFFAGLPGPQFAAPDALPQLREPGPQPAPFWVNAADPASACGLGLAGHPARQATTHLVYRGADLIVVSKRHGADITITASPDAPEAAAYFAFCGHLLTRSFQPLRRVVIDQINGVPASRSPFLAVLQREFELVTEHHRVLLQAPASLR